MWDVGLSSDRYQHYASGTVLRRRYCQRSMCPMLPGGAHEACHPVSARPLDREPANVGPLVAKSIGPDLAVHHDSSL